MLKLLFNDKINHSKIYYIFKKVNYVLKFEEIL
jgi:hypothetical protein